MKVLVRRSIDACAILVLYCERWRLQVSKSLRDRETVAANTSPGPAITRKIARSRFLPVAVQFVGRWGLYRFVTNKFNSVPGHAYYDAFEDRKQPLELAAVLGGVAVACLA